MEKLRYYIAGYFLESESRFDEREGLLPNYVRETNPCFLTENINWLGYVLEVGEGWVQTIFTAVDDSEAHGKAVDLFQEYIECIEPKPEKLVTTVVSCSNKLSHESVEAIKELWEWLKVPYNVGASQALILKRNLIDSIFNNTEK